jgi:hypothetical protein
MALLELLSGARGYLVVDDRMRDVLRKELASGNADPSVLREFATVHVALASDAVRRLDTPEGRDSGAVASTAEPTPAAPPHPSRARSSAGVPAGSVATPRAASPAQTSARRGTSGQVRTVTVAATGEACRFCGGALPPGRQITFCPHCGQNITVINCAACGTELELEWSFCTTCGRAVNVSE